jgi:hypothetical protein
MFFGVFEFKSMFEFNCLSVFQIENPSPLALLSPTYFWPVLCLSPVHRSPLALPLLLAQRATSPVFPPPLLVPAKPSAPRRPTHASAAARWGQLVIPHLAPCPGRTRVLTPSLRRARPCAWPQAHLPGRPGPIKATATPRLRRLRIYPKLQSRHRRLLTLAALPPQLRLVAALPSSRKSPEASPQGEEHPGVFRSCPRAPFHAARAHRRPPPVPSSPPCGSPLPSPACSP